LSTQDVDKQTKNTVLYTQTNSNQVTKSRDLLQTPGGTDEMNLVFFKEIVTDITTRN